MTKLELLSPARDFEVGRAAVLHGADAIYIGGPTHGARAAASNSWDEIHRLVDFAHPFGVKVYVTLNTIVYESELSIVEASAKKCWEMGVDALIVQDMSLLRLDIPPIALHASTQCDIRTPQKAAFLADCGFSQLVLPRELSIDEIAAIRAAVPADVALEGFVHGALCVSYSGDCQASFVANGRSANRGECAQMCRMAYDLLDKDGNILIRDKHLLSLRDLCLVQQLPLLAQAGISSFKIEGRLKDANYVKNVVPVYRQAIDKLIEQHPHLYECASWGKSTVSFAPDVHSAFNRGFTTYFTNPAASKADLANIDTPKWIGKEVGTVIRQTPRYIEAKLSAELSNGDGLGYFDSLGRFTGFRLNRVEGNKLFPASDVKLAAGTSLYRNRDVKRDAILAKETAVRSLKIDMTLRWPLALKIESESGVMAEVSGSAIEAAPAKSPQRATRRNTLSKLGDTIYRLDKLTDEVPDDIFIPVSVLAQLRRDAIAALDRDARAIYHYDMRRPENTAAKGPQAITYHDNVANRQSAAFYREHGASTLQSALEVKPIEGEKTVMTTRYCLRRQLGACLKEPTGKRLPSPLFLRNAAAKYRLDFDCANCQMFIKV